MSGVMAATVGAVAGLIGSAPMGVLLLRVLEGRSEASFGVGAACVLTSFLLLTCSVLVVCLFARQAVVSFGVCEAIAFLAVFAALSVRAQRAFSALCRDEGK